MRTTSENDCPRIHLLLERFLDQELDAAEVEAFRRHLEHCVALSSALETRTAFRSKLRQAVQYATAPEGLKGRIRTNLLAVQEHGWQRPGTPRWAQFALAAALLIAFAAGLAWRSGGLRFTRHSQESYIASLAPEVVPLMQVGLRQHLRCAVFQPRPRQIPSLEELARTFGPGKADLIPMMRRYLPGHFRILAAHVCRYKGRFYTHVTAASGSSLISLLITRREFGEALEKELREVTKRDGVSLYGSSAQRFSIAGFETRDHVVYLVSDLGFTQNLAMLESMAPDVARTIRTLESGAA